MEPNHEVEDILRTVRKVLHASRAALSLAPIPGLPLVADALVQLIDKIQAIRYNHIGLQALCRDIQRLVTIVAETQTRTENRIAQSAQDEIGRQDLLKRLRESSALSERIERFVHSLQAMNNEASELYRGRSYVKGYLYSERDARTLQNLQRGVQDAIQWFQIEGQVAIEASVDHIAHNVTILAEKVEDIQQEIKHVKLVQDTESDERVLERLPHTDNVMDVSKENYLDGTRSEIFDEIISWVDGSTAESARKGKGICVLSGGAGSGKSAIAAELARRLNASGQLGASVFSFRDPNALRLLFSTIAYQLACFQAALRPHIVSAAREYRRSGFDNDMQVMADALIVRPLTAIRGVHPPVVVVIDALEECTEQASEILTQLIRIVHTPFPLRVFVTSRLEFDIEDTLSRASSDIHTVHLHSLPRKSIDRDIATFFRERIFHAPSSQVILQDRPKVIEHLTHHAEGFFMYARTIADFLKRDPDHLYEQIGRILSDSPDARRIALKPLDDLFRTVLEKAYSPQDLEDERMRERLQAVLGCIALLRAPLSPRALESLVRIPCADSVPVLKKLRSVVLVDPVDYDAQFYPIHSRFPQFLLDDARCANAVYRVDARKAHERLADGCLRTLLSLTRNICQLTERDRKRPKAEVFDLVDRVRRYVPPHAHYACVHWAEHLKGAGRNRGLVELLRKFVLENLNVWLEALSYIGKLDVAEGALAEASICLTVPKSSKLKIRLDDARQLVVSRFVAINECPSRVYGYTIVPDPVRHPTV